MKYLSTAVLYLALSFGAQAQYWTKTNAAIAATGADATMFATHCGDTVVGIALTNQLGYQLTYSTDKGNTWSSGTAIFDTLIDGYIPEIRAVKGIGNRLYTQIQLANSSYFNLYYYSEDLGNSWVLDTAGLPKSWNPSYVDNFELSELSGGYMVAYSSLLGAYFKHSSSHLWVKQPTSSSWTGTYNLDFTYVGNTWYALNNASGSTGEVLNTSTDFGQTWTTVSISGLPSGFTPFNLVSNHDDKFFISGSISGSNANEIYFSDDAGVTWNSTNTASLGQYTYASVYARDLFAIEDYVFTTFYPTTGDTVSRILTSNAQVPNFAFGDVTGLPIYASNLFALAPPTLNYFNVDDVLFITYRDDIYKSTPGFTGATSGIGQEEEISQSWNVYPNPSKGVITVESQRVQSCEIYSVEGKLVRREMLEIGANRLELDLPKGLYLVRVGTDFKRLLLN